MESATTLLEGCVSTASQCGICTKKEQLKIGFLVISFILGTVDMVTDWINWNQWRSVGGYDQHYFVYIFITAFLCAAGVGTVLWLIEVILMIHRFWKFIRERLRRSKTAVIGYNSLSDRLGMTVKFLVGLLEDLPVVVLLYYSAVIPFCGVPASRERSSPTTIATVVSAMLNSMWTMFILYWELCGCNKKFSDARCCCTVIRPVYELPTFMSICYCGWCGCVTTSNCGCFCLGQCQGKQRNYSKAKLKTSRESGGSLKKCLRNTFYVGKILVLGVVFVVFMAIFVLSAMTLSFVNVKPILEKSLVTVGELRREIQADVIGPGLDSRTDSAMFVTLVYELPNLYHVGLYDNRNINIANSASVHQIQNRLYIGQFEELEHLKEESLTKAIPCTKVFPFLDKIDQKLFQWNNLQQVNITDFLNCKLIFRLMYYPTNNNWNPFINFVHTFYNYITVEWGIYIEHSETCPTGFQPLPASSLLTDTVKQDIVNYTCNLPCNNATDICRKATNRKFEENQFRTSLVRMIGTPKLYLTINNQQFPDSCTFRTKFEFSMKFCDKLWADIQPVKVPDFVQKSYPQFITIPMTYEKTKSPYVLPESKCNKLWVEGQKIGF